jgi:hypothetical protein
MSEREEEARRERKVIRGEIDERKRKRERGRGGYDRERERER